MSPLQELRWTWRNHCITYTRSESSISGSSTRGAVLCVHGFGASRRHWRHNLQALAAEADVFAVDLLGFGNSSKPMSCLGGEVLQPGAVRYSFDLWAEQLCDFYAEVIGPERDLQLIGNSIGGVVALNTARLLEEAGRTPRQAILIDCAERELDLKRLEEQPWLAQRTRPLLMAMVRQRWLIQSLFRFLAQPGFVRGVLKQAYPSGANVDAELVDLLISPSREPGASESFRGFVNLFDDWLAPQLLERIHCPVRLLWGEADPWEPVEEAQRWAQQFNCIQEFTVLPGLGHCPHDESPEQVNPILLRWLKLGWA